MRQRGMLAATVLFLLVAAVASAQAAGATQKQESTKVQIVKLSFDEKGYVVTPSRVTKGVPVRMDVDLDTVKGCMRTVVISAFDVKKTVKAGDTTIEFTPTKSGDIQIVCGMNMGKGTITVVEPK
ncbi:MAG: cupredoxin domain-containing protein [Acidobacteria bacterium]|nr:cupredoxin domain-containing protein [Planctomycetota bacterium]MBE3132274.1 cupredoxin domain-containing protein [Acidobacteriota bacterium]